MKQQNTKTSLSNILTILIVFNTYRSMRPCERQLSHGLRRQQNEMVHTIANISAIVNTCSDQMSQAYVHRVPYVPLWMIDLFTMLSLDYRHIFLGPRENYSPSLLIMKRKLFPGVRHIQNLLVGTYNFLHYQGTVLQSTKTKPFQDHFVIRPFV